MYNEKNFDIVNNKINLLKKCISENAKKGLNIEHIFETIESNLNVLYYDLNETIESLLIDWVEEKRNINEIDKIAKKYNLGVAFYGDGGLYDLSQEEINELKQKRLIKFEIEINFEYNNIIINRDISKLLEQ